MSDDFFADLLPLKAKKGTSPATPDVEIDKVASDLAATTSHQNNQKASYQEVGDLLGKDPRDEIPADFASGKAGQSSGVSDSQQVEQVEAVVHKALHKFAGALQPILASLTRQLEDLSTKVDQITSTLHTSQTSTKQNDAIIEHLSSLENGMKDLQKTVRLVSERQETTESEAKVRAKASEQEEEKRQAAQISAKPPAQQAKPPVAEVPTPAPSLNSNSSTVLPPGPSLPLPTVPPLPATAPPATPTEAPHQQPQPPAPVEVAQNLQSSQNLQRYGSNASTTSQPQFAFSAPPAQPRAQEQQGPGQSVFSGVQQGQQPPYNNPQQQHQQQAGHQQGYPPNPQHPPPAPQTPPYNAPPHSSTQTFQPAQSQTPRPQYTPPSQPFSGSYSQPPARQFYSQGPATPTQFSNQENSPYSGSYGGSSSSQAFNTQSSGGYPTVTNLPPPSRYGGNSTGQTFGPPPPPRSFPSQSYSSSRPEPQRPSGPQSPQNVPLEKVIDDIANMGFSRHEARSVINELQDRGQAVDLNVVLDRLMNGPRR